MRSPNGSTRKSARHWFKVDKVASMGSVSARRENAGRILWIEEEADHKPNGNRIAFWAESRAAVDKVGRSRPEGGRGGEKHREGPELGDRYSTGYYAGVLRSPDGEQAGSLLRESAVARSNSVDASRRAVISIGKPTTLLYEPSMRLMICFP